MATYRVGGGSPYKVVQVGGSVSIKAPPTRTEAQFVAMVRSSQDAQAAAATSAQAAQAAANLVGAPAASAMNAWWQGYSSATGRAVATAADAAAARAAIQAAPLDTTLPADTGWVTGIAPTTASWGSAGPIAGAGANDWGGRIWRGWCTVSFRVSYTGSTITADSTGNVTDTVITTISDARFRPPRNMQSVGTISGGATWYVRLGSTGVLHLTHGSFNGQALASGSALDIEITWQV